jgi:hypothetical protein
MKGEVFLQASSAEGHALIAPTHVAIARASHIVEHLHCGRRVLCGEGAKLLDLAGVGAHLLHVEPPHDVPRASAIARLAGRRAPTPEIEPLYVRPPDITSPVAQRREPNR